MLRFVKLFFFCSFAAVVLKGLDKDSVPNVFVTTDCRTLSYLFYSIVNKDKAPRPFAVSELTILVEMDHTQMAIEYLLVYCTSHGLTAIGEPALPKTYQPVGESLKQCSRASQDPNPDCKQAMPVWIISTFVLTGDC